MYAEFCKENKLSKLQESSNLSIIGQEKSLSSLDFILKGNHFLSFNISLMRIKIKVKLEEPYLKTS